jgi:hypothetical protein
MPVPPFAPGDVLWRVCSPVEKITLPCPVCAGNLSVDVVLGTGETLSVPCDGCGTGYDGPRGHIEEWQQVPRIESAIVAGVESFRSNGQGGIDWTVRFTNGSTASYDRLFHNADEAMVAAEAQSDALTERNLMQRRRRQKSVSKLAWTIRYHREQIKRLEEQIAWHRRKLAAQKGE